MKNLKEELVVNPAFCKHIGSYGSIWDFNKRQCGFKPKIDGYCKRHHPRLEEERIAKRNEKWKRERLQEEAIRENAKRNQYNRIKDEILYGKTLFGTCLNCKYMATPPRMSCLHKSGGLLNPTYETGCSYWKEKNNDT